MILTVLIVLAAGAVLLFLSRRWSEMPAPSPPPPQPEGMTRSTGMPPAGASAGPANPEAILSSDEWMEDDGEQEEAVGEPMPADAIPARLPIDHPLLVKAAAQAIASGGSRYFGREGDDLYFNLAALPDPEERARACAILLSLHEAPGAGPAGIADVLWLLRRVAGD